MISATWDIMRLGLRNDVTTKFSRMINDDHHFFPIKIIIFGGIPQPWENGPIPRCWAWNWAKTNPSDDI
jgi:hypothetical protein